MASTAHFNKADAHKTPPPPLLPVDNEQSELTTLLKVYLKTKDIQKIWDAYRFSEEAHHGQSRRSGEPYIVHPVAVACTLARLHLDAPTILAALLHDVVEDTTITNKEIEKKFGKQVSVLVDGLSKLDKIEFQDATEAQAENFRKMLLAMSNDVRVILVKLADRLHNMQTLDVLRPEKQKRIAQETHDIYAPIANRLGLNTIYQELEDLSFKHLYPMRYRAIQKAMKASRGNRREVVEKITASIQQKLVEMKMEAEVTGREKNTYSIYKKMSEKSMSFAQINDIYAFRIIVKEANDAYSALGALHSLYKPLPGKFKDYIAIPKANGYQSLHTSLFGPFGTPIEVQIRSEKMHKLAEAGVAAHWLYKTKDTHLTELQQQTHQWLKRLLEIQSDSADSLEFLEHLKVDLFPDEVYVFTPKGKILALPKGSTAVDFAYAVHSDVGNCCVAAKYNQELVPLRAEVHNGDHIEIITAPLAKPNPAWLNFVITGKARSYIRQYLKSIESEESSRLGEGMLNQALKALHISPSSIKESHWKKLISDYGLKTKEDILAEIGLGKRMNVMVAHQLSSFMDGVSHVKGKHKQLDVITIKGSESMAIQLAACCHPIPGDPILGFINKDKGLVVHTHDCLAIRKFKLDPDKWLDVEWDPNPDRLFKVNLQIMVLNERGMLAKISSVIAESDSNIDNVNVEESDGGHFVNVNFIVQVHNRIHLAELIRNLRKISNISRISRVKMKTS